MGRNRGALIIVFGGIAFALAAAVMWWVLSRGGSNGTPPLGFFSAAIGGIAFIAIMTVVNRSGSRALDAATSRYVGALAFSILPFPPVRAQVAQLRSRFGIAGAEPSYGFARPVVVVDTEAVRLLLTGEESSEFLAIPRAAIASVGKGSVKVSLRRFDTLALDVDTSQGRLRLDLPACDPSNPTAPASAAHLDELLQRARTELLSD